MTGDGAMNWGCLVFGTRYKVPDTVFWDSRSYWVLGTGYWVLGTKSLNQNTNPDIRY
jgi:hypothetical protein